MTAIRLAVRWFLWRTYGRSIILWFELRILAAQLWTGPGSMIAWTCGQDVALRWAHVRSEAACRMAASFEVARSRHARAGDRLMELTWKLRNWPPPVPTMSKTEETS